MAAPRSEPAPHHDADRQALEDQVRDLSRGLLFYRGVLLVLLAVLGFMGWRLAGHAWISDFGEPGEVWTVDLAERLRLANVEHGHQADYSETYFETEDASAHMHFMGFGQTTPMHLHPVGSEVVIIAGGTAEVSHAWGEDGELRTRQWTHPTGSLVASPPHTAHEWFNPDQRSMLANLVFAAPRFAGNLYVDPEDPRVLDGAPPTALRPAEALPDFLATGAPHALEQLPVMEGRFHQLLVADAFTLPPNPGQPLVGYVAAGRGTADGHALAPRVLVHLESDAPVEIRAEPGAPLAIALFDPEGALSEGAR